MMAAAALFQILLFTAIQAHAPTGQTGRFMSLITVCACLTQPAGQAAFGLLYGLFAALPSAVLFTAAACKRGKRLEAEAEAKYRRFNDD